MNRTTTKISRSRTAALAFMLAALAAPTAAAQQQDLRSPDARDAGRAAPAAPKQDLRSPDARESGRTAAPAAAGEALAQERYYPSYGTRASSAALAEEQYLSSHGQSAPQTRPQSPVPSDDTPWLPIALSIAAALVILAATATRFRRLRLRRRHAVRVTA